MNWRPVDRRGALPDQPSTTRHRRSFFAFATPSNTAVFGTVVAAICLLAFPWRAGGAGPRDSAAPTQAVATLDPPTGSQRPSAVIDARSTRAPAQRIETGGNVAVLASEPKTPQTAGRSSVEEDSARLLLTLVDEGGAAIAAGATLELRRAEDGSLMKTKLAEPDANGASVLELEPGEVQLVVWRASRIGGPLMLELNPGEEHSARLVLRGALPVSGRIVDEVSGAALTAASVRFWTFAEADVATTDANGTFTHPRFPVGADLHQVRVESEGYGAVVRYLSFERDGRWALYSNLAGKPDISGRDGRPWIELSLARACSLTGRVVNACGTPVSGAQVLAEGYVRTLDGVATRDFAEGLTDASGRFVLAGLRADIGHGVRVHAPGYAIAVHETEPAAFDLGSLVLQPGRVVSGTVLAPCGAPASDIVVELVDLAQATPLAASPADAALRLECARRRALTDANGVFLFEDAADGAASVRILIQGRVVENEAVAHGNGSGLVFQLPAVLEQGPAAPSALALAEQP